MADQRKIIADGVAAPAEALPGGSIVELQGRLAEFARGRGSDKLTGLPDRTSLIGALERVVAGVNCYGTTAALIILDLDGCWEGEAGKAEFVRAAGLVAGLVRSTDFAARIGEAGFALILDDLDHNSAIETSERIARCLTRASAATRVWLGVAAILKGDSAEDAMRRAELNLARARDGR